MDAPYRPQYAGRTYNWTGLYVGANGGWPEALTHKMDAQHLLGGAPYSPDMKTITYAGNDIDPMNMEVIIRDVATGAVTRPFPSGGAICVPASWSHA